MYILVLAGILALAGAQTTIDPSVLINIFGTPPTPTDSGNTRQPLEEVPTIDPSILREIFGPPKSSRQKHGIEDPQDTKLAKVKGSTTIKPSILAEVFGTPPSLDSPKQRPENVNSTRNSHGARNVNVVGLPTIKPSLLVEIFGTPPTPSSSIQPHENGNPKKNPQNTSNSQVNGVPTIKPSLLTEVFGTPPAPPPSRQTHEHGSPKKHPQDTSNSQLGGVPTIKPSILTEVFGTPPAPPTSRQTHEHGSPNKHPQDTSNSQINGVPKIKPSILTEVFGTPPAPPPSRQPHENGSPNRHPQDTSNSKVKSVATIKPSILTEVFGTPPAPNPQHKGEGSPDPEGTRDVKVIGLPTVVPSLIIDDFWTPPTTPKSLKEHYEDITVKPTDGTATYTDKDGGPCQCVPYYLCDANNVGVDVNNASVTGWGTLDIRFGEDDNTIDRQCQESVEVCCAIPKDPAEVPKPPKPQPQPDPTKVKGCGYRNPQGLGVTITGGTGAESQFGEFPWVVALLDNRNSSYAGVGVLIHPKVVMTGAHVAQKYGPGELKIRAGEWDTQTIKEIYPFEERIVQSIIIHENFMPKSLKNDMALLLLDRPLDISEHINVICMPDQEEVFDSSKNCVANGWGKSHFGQSNRYAVILKKVEVDMVPYNRCNALLKRTRLGHNFKLHSSFVCAGGEAGKDTCQGDGGAPLACPIGNNRYKLTGLVAWGIGCGQQDVPAVYTNVPIFRQWVDDKMADWGLEATSYRISK